MKLLIKPHYKKDSFFIDTNKAFTKSFRYDQTMFLLRNLLTLHQNQTKNH